MFGGERGRLTHDTSRLLIGAFSIRRDVTRPCEFIYSERGCLGIISRDFVDDSYGFLIFPYAYKKARALGKIGSEKAYDPQKDCQSAQGK